MAVEQHEIDRFEGEGGVHSGRVVHMSDGHDLNQADVADYKKSHPGVQVVNQQSPATGEAVSRKLTQEA
jgi:hypothetical protein